MERALSSLLSTFTDSVGVGEHTLCSLFATVMNGMGEEECEDEEWMGANLDHSCKLASLASSSSSSSLLTAIYTFVRVLGRGPFSTVLLVSFSTVSVAPMSGSEIPPIKLNSTLPTIPRTLLTAA